jgi:hypothetical protein
VLHRYHAFYIGGCLGAPPRFASSEQDGQDYQPGRAGIQWTTQEREHR